MNKVETFVNDDTACLRKHMAKALVQLEAAGKFEGRGDEKRRKGPYPNEAVYVAGAFACHGAELRVDLRSLVRHPAVKLGLYENHRSRLRAFRFLATPPRGG